MNSLSDLRSEIDHIDSQLVELLGERGKIVQKIGDLKKTTNKTSLDLNRWGQVLRQVKQSGEKHSVPAEVIEKIWNELHRWSLQLES